MSIATKLQCFQLCAKLHSSQPADSTTCPLCSSKAHALHHPLISLPVSRFDPINSTAQPGTPHHQPQATPQRITPRNTDHAPAPKRARLPPKSPLHHLTPQLQLACTREYHRVPGPEQLETVDRRLSRRVPLCALAAEVDLETWRCVGHLRLWHSGEICP